MSRLFISTSIPYVNARPHVGFAFEAVLADAVARYRRARGLDVLFLSGTDDNSLKNVEAARDAGVGVKELVERNGARFYALRSALNLSYDDFIHTGTDARHAPAVAKLWRRCAAAGDIYLDDYTGLYCVGCEHFVVEQDLEDGLCPEHHRKPEEVSEKNYFFRLSRYRDDLLRLLDEGRMRVVPETRRAEIVSLIRTELRDFSISRSVERAHGWGIGVPGDPGQVTYVWFDALTNYISALGYGRDASLFRDVWAGGHPRIHVIGKGILRFHAVYWPAMLLSAGELPPSSVLVHGYLTVDGQKISKSLGNVVDPEDLALQFGSDAVRFYLLRGFRTGEDGDFSIGKLVRFRDSDLADQFGNLVGRVSGLIHRFGDGIVPVPGPADDGDAPLRSVAHSLIGDVDAAVGAFQLDRAVERIWEFVRAANRYVVEQEPWTLARHDDERSRARLGTVLYNLVESVRIAAMFAGPVIPVAAERTADMYRLGSNWGRITTESVRWGATEPGTPIDTVAPLFPKNGSSAR